MPFPTNVSFVFTVVLFVGLLITLTGLYAQESSNNPNIINSDIDVGGNETTSWDYINLFVQMTNLSSGYAFLTIIIGALVAATIVLVIIVFRGGG